MAYNMLFLTDRGARHQEAALRKPGACLVHPGSGSALDETEVLHLLQEGRIAYLAATQL